MAVPAERREESGERRAERGERRREGVGVGVRVRAEDLSNALHKVMLRQRILAVHDLL